jgi:alginate biosynthesis protein AlgX
MFANRRTGSASQGGRALTLMAALLATLTSAHGSAAASVAPTYKAATCCTLCPRAADPDAYVTRFMTSNRVTIQGTEDWLFRTEVDLDTVFTVDDAVYAALGRLVQRLNARGTQVLLLDLPRRGLLTADKLLPSDRARYEWRTALANYRKALQRFRDVGFIVPDYGLLVEKSDGTEYFFRRDGHWTPDGARRTAELIADTVKSTPLHERLRKKDFATRRVGLQRHPGVLAIVASQICGGHYPAEVVGGYSTAPLESNPFDDDPIPEIALVGTSFSASPAYHFAGFLQQALQTDVLNTAIAGGNFDGALTQYLPSDTFQLSPPKLLIWEFAHAQIAAVNPAQLRRLTPLVDNGCVGKDALLQSEVRVSSDEGLTEVLFNGGDRIIPAKSRELVVDLQFADPTVSEILGEAWYLDGKHELLRVRMNDYTRANGRFALELNRTPDFSEQPMIDFRVQVVTPLVGPTTVSAKLCRHDHDSH